MTDKNMELLKKAAEEVYNKRIKLRREVEEYLDGLFKNGLGDMIEEMINFKIGQGKRLISIMYDNCSLYEIEIWYCSGNRHITIKDMQYKYLLGCNRLREIKDLDSISSIKSEYKEYKNELKVFDKLQDNSNYIVNYITQRYEEKVQKDTDDLTNLLNDLGVETEKSKQIKVTVEWI